jgi:hypothetical protein
LDSSFFQGEKIPDLHSRKKSLSPLTRKETVKEKKGKERKGKAIIINNYKKGKSPSTPPPC